MNSQQTRKKFLDFFASKGHRIVSSAPMVIKNDPSLMFTNAGMNQFKDIFLGNSTTDTPRIANAQKCLRVSGKHNDLEEVGLDTYHHTMFEMLGNWSFGDYFKKEAIEWAWELLTDELKIDKTKLYVTVFEGSAEDNLEADTEAMEYWKKHIDTDRILRGSKKDNFWEMGDSGPCGPCSEIHIDLRSTEERKKKDGKELVNTGHPQVIEIWNLVFIQYHRKANGTLELLPNKHVDTGMGFERLCMVLQEKTSAYDTDIFQPIIKEIEKISDKKYNSEEKSTVAMRVIADHIRAVSFTIADGELPSNTGAGYVIRRILRRAIRYGYTFLGQQEPFIFRLLPVLADTMGTTYPELTQQRELIQKVIKEEETAFLKTLATGMALLDNIMTIKKTNKESLIEGATAFKLYDTYGFPLDLTELILRENGLRLNKEEFDAEMQKQKERSRKASNIDADDWNVLHTADIFSFLGYDSTSAKARLLRYRKVKTKNKELYHLVFDRSPFYAESGGQIGDTGIMDNGKERIAIIDTKKENNLFIHIVEKLPTELQSVFTLEVDEKKRKDIERNHSATHLLHYALRKVLGNHVEQKGSLVHSEYLRFDFSHFKKMTKEELLQTEAIANEMVRKNIIIEEQRSIDIEEARKQGAMTLFGEKYGEKVRTIRFGESLELCGGTHVQATGQIGLIKICSEGAIAAGIRRIEAVSGKAAESYVNNCINKLEEISNLMKNPKDLPKAILQLTEENSALKKQQEQWNKEKAIQIKQLLLQKIQNKQGMKLICEMIETASADILKDIAFQLKTQYNDMIMILGAKTPDKAYIAIMISEGLTKEKKLHAGNIIKEIAPIINGGGGGQAFFATAGGSNVQRLRTALDKAVEIIGL